VVNREGRVQGGKKGGATQAAIEYQCPICGRVVKGNFGRASHARAHLKTELAGAVLAEADNKVEERPAPLSGEPFDGGPSCSPGAEWACKLATGSVCNCACGGKNHGVYANAPAAEVAGAIVGSMDDETAAAIVRREDARYNPPIGDDGKVRLPVDPELKSSKGKTILPEQIAGTGQWIGDIDDQDDQGRDDEERDRERGYGIDEDDALDEFFGPGGDDHMLDMIDNPDEIARQDRFGTP
jgi:hypothetical protein